MIRVLVVEEVRAIGEMIAAVLCAQPDIDVLGPASRLEALEPRLLECDVALVDAGPAGVAVLGLIRRIRAQACQVKIIVFGLACGPAFVLECAQAGAAGYVGRDSSLSGLLDTIRAAHTAEALISAPLAAACMSGPAERVEALPSAPRSELRPLTRREREVLGLLQQGLTNQAIARSLVIELGTVKNHVHNILRKLNLNSRRETLRLGRAGGGWGWTEPGHAPLNSREALAVPRPLEAKLAPAASGLS